MNARNKKAGFSLVELLAVVLVLAVLAAVAIPLYTSQRKSAAGRTCKANLAAISSSLSAIALRTGAYPTTASYPTALVGAAEGLTQEPKCPLDGVAYVYTLNADGSSTIKCPNDAEHVGYGGVANDWTKTLVKPATDTLP